jgi:hypothetical protein
MNLAEQVRQVRELKKAYDSASDKFFEDNDRYSRISNCTSPIDMIVIDLILKAKKDQDAFYFISSCSSALPCALEHVTFYQSYSEEQTERLKKTLEDLGFKTNTVELEHKVPLRHLKRPDGSLKDEEKWLKERHWSGCYKLTVKALKITW